MNESDKLRAMLDELGIEYEAYAYVLDGMDNRVEVTRVRDKKSGRIIARFMSCDEPGKVDVAAKLAPEQAIAATLGDTFAAHLLGVTARQDERIAALEALVRDMHRDMHGCWYCHNCGSCDRDECMFEERMRELGVM